MKPLTEYILKVRISKIELIEPQMTQMEDYKEMYDGKITGIVNADLNYIDFAAEMCDVSREVISVEEYERRFNRKFEFYKKPE